MSAVPVARCCPNCGGTDSLYGRADIRWSHDRLEWIVGDMEDGIECTECDWSGTMADTIASADAEAA